MRAVMRSLAVSLVLVAGCGAETVAPVAVMILTNTWRVEGEEAHTFQFQDDTGFEPKAEGTFTGTERLADGATEYALSGYWQNSRVYLTVQRTPVRTYTARIKQDNTDRLEFSGSAGSFVLLRN